MTRPSTATMNIPTDPIVAIGIGLWVLPRTWILLKDTSRILLEGAPPGMALAGVRKAITEMLGVASVHELHLWTTGADQAVCTVHVVLADGAVGEDVRKAIAARLETDFDLHHVTIQTEVVECAEEDRHA